MSESIRVLVADDNRTDRTLLSKIVAREGHEVITAVDGIDALEKFVSERPQIVLLDALMPRLDGFEVARRIRQQAGDAFIPIIFLTSLTEADELARCLMAGGDDFLSKPYNSVILRAKITALERMRQLHATMQEQRDEIAQYNARLLREQQAAKDIFDSVAHSGCLAAKNIRHLISPLAVFNGDVVLAARNPAGSMYVLLGDFTGHGLTASIGAMPLAEIFYGMTQKGFLLADVLRECNRKLKEILPVGYFCCATMVDFNFQKGTVEVWSGGLPDAYITRSGGGPATPVTSRHLPLGVVSTGRFDASTEVYELARGDRLLMCTDGLLESRNGSGEMFGSERLIRILESNDADVGFEAVKEAAYAHMGEQLREDDLTLVEVTMLDEHEIDAPMPTYVASGQIGPRDWSLSFQLGPSSLREFNPLPLLQHVLMEVPALRVRGGVIFTVLSELYTNALDHGVMGLSSVVKSTANGFTDYYQRRIAALNALVDGYVRFEFVSQASDGGGYLSIRVHDSGRGFDVSILEAARANDTGAYHGRGLNLLYQLCDSLTFHGTGNDVEASFRWGETGEAGEPA
jgi:CheY-like chemotaxis protein/anti-sigma regulatory factor (Ser/Thr protein kinase)